MTRDLPTNLRRSTKLALLNEARGVRELASNYAEAIEAIRADLAKLYERYAENGVLTNAEMTKYNRLASLERQLTEELRPVALRNNRLLDKLASVQYEEAFYRHAWAIDQTAGVSLKWGMLSPDQVAAAVSNPLGGLAKQALSRATVERVRRAVAQGLIRGTTLRQMMIGIRDAMNTTANEAMRIARTEAHRARELGNLLASGKAEDLGVQVVRVWDATLDDRTRARHANLDGQPESDGGWTLEGVKAQYPGDPSLPASQSINCRCTAIDTVEGYSPSVRRVRGEGLQPYQTFETWAKSHGVKASRYGETYNFVGAA